MVNIIRQLLDILNSPRLFQNYFNLNLNLIIINFKVLILNTPLKILNVPPIQIYYLVILNSNLIN